MKLVRDPKSVKKKKSKKVRKRSVLLTRTAALKALAAANSSAEDMHIVVALLEHEPGVQDLVIAVKALRAIASQPDSSGNDWRLAQARGLASRALKDMGLT